MEIKVGSFATLYMVYSCLIDLPRMGIVVILGVIALFVGVVLFSVDNNAKTNGNTADLGDAKEKYLVLGSSLLLFISMFLLNGPTELYVYNTADFMFQYKDFIVYMIGYALIMSICFLPGIVNYMPDSVVKAISIIINLF